MSTPFTIAATVSQLTLKTILTNQPPVNAGDQPTIVNAQVAAVTLDCDSIGQIIVNVPGADMADWALGAKKTITIDDTPSS